MSTEIDWSKAPEGFTIWLEGIGEHACWSGWYREAGEVFKGADGGQFRAVREGQFFVAHRRPEESCDHSYANTHGCPECGEKFSAPWSGEGLPPVGTVCEWLDRNSKRWLLVEIVFASSWVIVVRDTTPHPDGPVDVAIELLGEQPEFRPPHTPEQIVAEERHEIAMKMVKIMGEARRAQPDTGIPPSDMAGAYAYALYDAGYRLQDPEE